ncbi:A24 family peptidase [Nocardioides sp. C4-1]|uniref:A24 family peptidase n=1 Tax=Nocardioides sp. C4-1 TaxID=3151851 RepID=UPI0032667F00
MSDAVAIAGAAAACGAAGLALDRWLRLERYRYDDERDRPGRTTSWVPVVLVVAGALLGWRVGDHVALLVTFGAALVWMVGLAAIDVDVRRLPDRWTLPAVPVTAALLAWCSGSTGAGWEPWWTALACGLANGFVHLVFVVANPDGLGLGDAKLAVTLGLLTGWISAGAAAVAFLGSFVVGLVVGLVVAWRSGEGRKATFPFGPSMVLAAGVVVLLAAGG